ncbi:MAG TPA: hypothetical protein DIW64_03315 [Cellvibrio sp.]|nr:hypothetical protein [Cellvibrio sp.]
MKFAKYWSEASVPADEKIFGVNTLSTWGASNESQQQAGVNAMERAAKLTQIVSRGLEALREYEYWNGYIREEVIDEIKDADGRLLGVLTRNNYGAIVLNAESVFFGDIDVTEETFFSKLLQLFGRPKKDKAYHLANVEQFQKQNTEYTIKVYETFAGLRVVIVNRVFEQDFATVNALFSSLGVDPLYVTLCKVQSCYRARLTPKPWRIGIDRPLFRFPRHEQYELDGFSEWLTDYELAAKSYRTVKVVAEFGSDAVHPDVARVLEVHDQYACVSGEVLA